MTALLNMKPLLKPLLSTSFGLKLITDYSINSNQSLTLFRARKSRISLVRNYRFTPTMSRLDQQINDPIEPFRPKRVLVLAKFSRYEFEKRRNPNMSEAELIKSLESRGSDYKSLKHHHNIHAQSRDHIIQSLERLGVETKVVNRFDYTDEIIDWAQLIITSGGDGTFLMAASRVKSGDKPLIGVNSDPNRSVGYLCLPKKYSNNFDEALRLFSEGQFKWQFRQRIRVTLEGENACDEPIELHNQQLRHPEYRFLELEPKRDNIFDDKVSNESIKRKKQVLPFRALNEVFVGESLSSRVSYYEFALNSKQKVKLKSSGMTICTGTGSTSWSFNINKVTPQCVQNIFQIVNEEISGQNLPANDSQLIQRVTDRFNNTLIFDASEPTMAYTIRDPVVFGTDFHSNPRGFAKTIEIKSRMTEANIVIDGGLSYKFNDGANATFEILEEDALRTISLQE